MSNQEAPEGTIWVCGACGKTSRWQYGFDPLLSRAEASPGWDESCMLNAVLCHAPRGLAWQAVSPQPADPLPTWAQKLALRDEPTPPGAGGEGR